MTTQTILVTGATGNVGRHVATQLRDAGVAVRALSRDPSSRRRQAGVTVAGGDLTDPDSLRFADQALAYWASLIARPEPVTHAVEEITGAPARTFRDWARDHASDFRPRSPAEVVSRHISLLRQKDLGGALKLLAPDVLRVAPVEPAGGSAGLRGVEAIMDNSRRQTAGYEIRGVEIDGPHPLGDRFAVRFAFDEVHIPTGRSATTEKISVYSVGDGAITREDVYYHTPPHTP